MSSDDTPTFGSRTIYRSGGAGGEWILVIAILLFVIFRLVIA